MSIYKDFLDEMQYLIKKEAEDYIEPDQFTGPEETTTLPEKPEIEHVDAAMEDENKKDRHIEKHKEKSKHKKIKEDKPVEKEKLPTESHIGDDSSDLMSTTDDLSRKAASFHKKATVLQDAVDARIKQLKLIPSYKAYLRMLEAGAGGVWAGYFINKYKNRNKIPKPTEKQANKLILSKAAYYLDMQKKYGKWMNFAEDLAKGPDIINEATGKVVNKKGPRAIYNAAKDWIKSNAGKAIHNPARKAVSEAASAGMNGKAVVETIPKGEAREMARKHMYKTVAALGVPTAYLIGRSSGKNKQLQDVMYPQQKQANAFNQGLKEAGYIGVDGLPDKELEEAIAKAHEIVRRARLGVLVGMGTGALGLGGYGLYRHLKKNKELNNNTTKQANAFNQGLKEAGYNSMEDLRKKIHEISGETAKKMEETFKMYRRARLIGIAAALGLGSYGLYRHLKKNKKLNNNKVASNKDTTQNMGNAELLTLGKEKIDDAFKDVKGFDKLSPEQKARIYNEIVLNKILPPYHRNWYGSGRDVYTEALLNAARVSNLPKRGSMLSKAAFYLAMQKKQGGFIGDAVEKIGPTVTKFIKDKGLEPAYNAAKSWVTSHPLASHAGAAAAGAVGAKLLQRNKNQNPVNPGAAYMLGRMTQQKY